MINNYLGKLEVNNEDMGFTDIYVPFLDYPIHHIYISEETAANEKALEAFDKFLNNLEMRINEGYSILKETDDSDFVSYFEFFQEEVPDVFEIDNSQTLSKEDKVEYLKVCGLASHGSEDNQYFVIDFTIGYDQLLALKFNKTTEVEIAWES